MKGAVRPILILAALLIGALSARAQVTITVAGTADNGTGGYGLGNAYHFSFAVNSTFGNTPTSYFDGSTTSQWDEANTADDQLFNSITGDGVAGSFTRPVSGAGDPFSHVWVMDSSPILSIVASADISLDIGLTTPGLTPIRYIEALVTSGIPFADFDSYETPESYFAVSNSYLGFFAGAAGTLTVRDSSFVTLETFTITAISIAYTPIPEPSTYAAMLGVAAFGLAAWRRRRVVT